MDILIPVGCIIVIIGLLGILAYLMILLKIINRLAPVKNLEPHLLPL